MNMLKLKGLFCQKCKEEFDLEEHAPKLLPSCGCSICKQCLGQVLKADKPRCTIDGKVLSSKELKSYNDNYTLKHFIEEPPICGKHDKDMLLVCLVDKCRICVDCLEDDDHKQHSTKPISELRVEVNIHKEKLQKALKRLDKRSSVESDIRTELSILKKVSTKSGIEELISSPFYPLKSLAIDDTRLKNYVENFKTIQVFRIQKK